MCYLYKDLKMHIDGEGDAARGQCDGVNLLKSKKVLCFRV